MPHIFIRSTVRHRAVAFLMILPCLAPEVGYTQSKPAPAQISGQVVDRERGTPLADVQVYIPSLRRGDVTDREGRYRIDRLPPGMFTVHFSLQGYRSERRDGIVLKPGESVELNIDMASTILEMEELVVTASRNVARERDLPQSISVATAEEIQRRNRGQTPEILREEAGVFVQKTNQGGGSPILRGFRSNKLLLLVDGIRLNNSTYRGGNLQYLNTVDAFALERLEVVHGPVSVLYGSDALGGAINAITRTPSLADGAGLQWRGWASGLVSTADVSRLSSLGGTLSRSKWSLLFGISHKSFGDITRGSRGGEVLMQRLQNDSRAERRLHKKQAPNGYDAVDLNLKALFQIHPGGRLTVAYQLDRQNAVPRYDVIEAQIDSVWRYDPQERDLVYLTYQNFHRNALFDYGSLTLSLHRQFERRVRQGFGTVFELRDEYETVTLGSQLQFDKALARQADLVYGAELYFDTVGSKSTQRHTGTEAVSRRNPLYPDGSTYLSFGVFAHGEWRPRPGWMLTLGSRFSAFELKAPFDSYLGEVQNLGTVRQTPRSLTGSLGVKVDVAEGVSLVINIAQGFRAPNLDDVSKLGPGKGDNFFEVPNPAARPERTLSLDAGLKVTRSRLWARATGFTNLISDLLLRRPASFAGSPYIIQGGDTLRVFRKENAGRARTTGFELDAQWLMARNLALFGNLCFTHGQNLSDDEPLTGVPPLHGLVGGRWQTDSFWIEINSRFSAAQKRLSSEDRLDLRIPEGGTPGWSTVNLRFGVDVARGVSVGLAIENLLDRNYREHLSGFNAPGRNFILSGRLAYGE